MLLMDQPISELAAGSGPERTGVASVVKCGALDAHQLVKKAVAIRPGRGGI